jgi:hypothetical protein
MSDVFRCDDKEQLVAYLYDEVDGAVRRRIDDHLRVCATCAVEVAGLTGVRRELSNWAPPEAELGFAVVKTPVPVAAQAAEPPLADVLRPARWWRPQAVPAWAQAAAAVLVVAAGLSVANLQIRYGADGLVVTTGWMTHPGAATVTSQPAAIPVLTPTGPADWQPALSSLEATLRREIREARAEASEDRGTDVSMQRVADLIRQSERRQNQELALRLVQFGRDLEVQRRSDLVRINQGFGQFEGRAGAEIARQRQMIDYIMRVSTQPPPQ